MKVRTIQIQIQPTIYGHYIGLLSRLDIAYSILLQKVAQSATRVDKHAHAVSRRTYKHNAQKWGFYAFLIIDSTNRSSICGVITDAYSFFTEWFQDNNELDQERYSRILWSICLVKEHELAGSFDYCSQEE